MIDELEPFWLRATPRLWFFETQIDAERKEYTVRGGVAMSRNQAAKEKLPIPEVRDPRRGPSCCYTCHGIDIWISDIQWTWLVVAPNISLMGET